jgi:hypothetical protein
MDKLLIQSEFYKSTFFNFFRQLSHVVTSSTPPILHSQSRRSLLPDSSPLSAISATISKRFVVLLTMTKMVNTWYIFHVLFVSKLNTEITIW